ncbi:MAG: hypothetical protein M0R06_01035 [Sphaerochaeta sp.]|jgi:hypothetical protein|nr:hypothetical protein [Sphaerochaeta sp.]
MGYHAKDKSKRYMIGGARIGGVSNYLDISNAGAVTGAGTAIATRYMNILPYDCTVTGSWTVAVHETSGSFNVLRWSTALAASAVSDSIFYTSFIIPEDLYSSCAMTVSAFYNAASGQAAGSNVAAWTCSASFWNSGASALSASSAFTKSDTVAASGRIYEKELGSLTGMSAGDFCKMSLGLSGSLNDALGMDLFALRLAYRSTSF